MVALLATFLLPAMRGHTSLNLPARITGIRMRQLQLFQVLIEAGSISEAARRCHMTQPAATEVFKELERAFGAQLFIRGPRGIVLTTAGKHLAKHTARMLSELQSAISNVESIDESRQSLKLGFVSTAMVRLLPLAISILRDTNPNISISMKELNVTECSRALLAGDLDAAVTLNHISFESSEGSDELSIETLTNERYMIAASRDLRLARNHMISLTEAHEHPWILPLKESFLRRSFDNRFLQKGLLPPEAILEVSPISHAVRLLESIPALTLTSEWHVSKRTASSWHPLGCPELEPDFRLVFVCRSDYRNRPPVAALFNALKMAMLPQPTPPRPGQST